MSGFSLQTMAAVSFLCLGAAWAAPASPPNFSPNPSVGWISLGGDFMAPPRGAGPVGQDPKFPRVTNEEFRRTGRQPTIALADLNAPILQPWAREELRKQRELVQSGKGGTSRQANCWPTGPAFVLHVIHPIFIVQGPTEVVMIWQGDHQVRRIYLTDKHSTNPKPSWFGESIGHYEGDTLVVDTIGFNTKTYMDGFYTPHTEKLHIVERFRMIDGGKTMEVSIHVDDPGAFTMPWNAIQRWRRVEPGVAENNVPVNAVSSSSAAGPLNEMSCAENPFSYFGSESVAIPQADKANF
ncbi:MAG: hypothetical protein EXR00_00860 [Alphaproteobacteria bacterium]|nr:hypothetical protein [Alphaproteobacteria bacterium]